MTATDKPTIIVSETLASNPADWLARQVNLQWLAHDAPGFREQLANAQGLIVRTYTQVNAQLLAAAPRLRVVGRAGVGLENIDLDACRQRGITVVYTPDANTQAVVEYVLGLLFDALRPRTDLTGPIAPATFHQLRKTQVGRQLDQLTLGILGFGRIGKRLGRAAHALAVNLKVCDLLPEAQLRKAVDFPYQFVDHHTLYEKSDIVSIHVDGRPENHHLIDAQALAHFKRDTILVNAARGMLVDSAALADFAKANPEARIILDVHQPEPPTPDYPLWALPNVRLLPHLASRTHTAMDNMSWVVQDVLAVLHGREPQWSAT